MTPDEQDKWAKGLVYGLCRVLQFGDPLTGRREYPAILAGWVHIALKRIEVLRLDVDATACEYAARWLREVEGKEARRRKRK